VSCCTRLPAMLIARLRAGLAAAWLLPGLALIACSPESRAGAAAGSSPQADLPDPADTSAFARMRAAMVREQIEARGVTDTAVLRVMRSVPRHRFVPPDVAAMAYRDHPLPIGHGQTISQPYIVAYMAAAARIRPGSRVLEIGTGSGYGAAVLAGLAGDVYTIEILADLAERATATLDALGYLNVHVRAGNGWLGWPEHAPYDAIIVTAAPEEVPSALVDQLAVGGTLVIPVGDVLQYLRVLEKTTAGLRELDRIAVQFVPMVARPPDTIR